MAESALTPGFTTVAVLKRQFDPALLMLEQIIRRCPDELWHCNPHGQPIWKRVLHALESVDYHFSGIGGRYLFSDFGNSISAEFDGNDDWTLSRDELLAYHGGVTKKCAAVFNSLGDRRLSEVSSVRSELTLLDIIITQIRHLALNTGRCSEAFAANGHMTVEWKGYCE